MPAKPADTLRALCLALPEATEVAMRRGPTYRVNNKVFALERPFQGSVTVWCKAPPGAQAVLIGADPARFFSPPFVGPKGWIGVRLDDLGDWDELTTLIRRSYRLVGPSRLAALVP